MVVAAYLGWIVFGASTILLPAAISRNSLIDIVAVSMLTVFWASFAAQKSRFTLYLYIIFPIYFWHQALSRSLGRLSWLFSGASYGGLLMQGIAVVVALEGMVVRAHRMLLLSSRI